MPNYGTGKIYKFVCNVTQQIYIGSTTHTLSKRLSSHISNYVQYLKGEKNYITAYIIIENNDFEMSLIEDYPCETKDQLLMREREWIEQYPECVNKCCPIRTPDEKVELKKVLGQRYYEMNKDNILENNKKYRRENKDQISQKIKEWNEKHKDHVKERKKRYAEDNKELIREQRKQFREENRDRLNEESRRKYEKNREKYLEGQKKYYQKNFEIIAQKKKEYQEKHKDKISEYCREYRENNKERIQQQKNEKVQCECGSFSARNHLARHRMTKSHQEWITRELFNNLPFYVPSS